jgi:zinc transporter
MSQAKITSLYLDGHGGATDSESNHQAQNMVWHHLQYTDKKAKSWVKKKSKLSAQAQTVLLNSETRPRTLIDDEAILVCLRGINFNEDAEPEDMISIRIWLNNHEIITSSNLGSQTIRKVRAMLQNNVGPKNTEDLLLAIIDQLEALTDEFVTKMDEQIDAAEDRIDDANMLEFNPQMNQLRRQIAGIRRYLLPQKEAIDQLSRQKSKQFSASFYDQIYLYADKFIQLIENLDLIRERALMLQEHFMANLSHQQNSRLYLLAIISAIFLPLTFLSGLFGMNVAGMPGLEDTQAFWYIIIFSVGLTVSLLIWFKKSRWF